MQPTRTSLLPCCSLRTARYTEGGVDSTPDGIDTVVNRDGLRTGELGHSLCALGDLHTRSPSLECVGLRQKIEATRTTNQDRSERSRSIPHALRARRAE